MIIAKKMQVKILMKLVLHGCGSHIFSQGILQAVNSLDYS
jgi:hypothetical protein